MLKVIYDIIIVVMATKNNNNKYVTNLSLASNTSNELYITLLRKHLEDWLVSVTYIPYTVYLHTPFITPQPLNLPNIK